MVCRLCLQNSSEVLEIFNNKGQELKIATVIGKHFWFEPKVEDPVSSHICNGCWTKLSDFHEFYECVEKAQQLLTVEVIIKTEYSLTVSDVTVASVELGGKHELEENIEEQYEEPFNITPDVLKDDLKGQSIGIVNNEEQKDDQDISALHDGKEDESDVQFQIKDKKKILRKKGTKLKTSSERNEAEFLTEKATTAYKGRGRPRKEKAAKLRINNDASGFHFMTKEMSEIVDHKISEYMQLKCDVCGIEMDTFGHIINHMRSIHDVRPYVKCCDKKFTRRAWLYDHIKFHLNPDIYKCENCDKVFSEKRNFNAHVISMHPSEDTKIFECPHCPKKFARMYLLQSHKTQQHNKFKHFCPECKRGFPFMSGLKSHVALWHVTKCDISSKMQCDHCGSWHKGKLNLARHKKLHTYQEPQVCNVCKKTFPSRRTLYAHNYCVHQHKHECNIVGKKSFKTPRSLKEHMSKHSGLSLYRCPYCSRAFNYISAMHRHGKRKHPKEFEESRKPRKISSRRKEIIIPTILSLSDAKKNSAELPSKHELEENIEEQYIKPFKITSDVLAEDNYGAIDFEFPPDFKDEFIVNNEKEKDDQDISAIHDDKGDEYSLTISDITVANVELGSKHELEENIEEQYEEPFNITSDVLKDQSIGIVNNEEQKDDQDISAIHDDNGDESDLQLLIIDKKKILRKKGTELKSSSERTKVKSLTEKVTTHKEREPRKGKVGPLKNESNCNKEKAAKLRINNDASESYVMTKEMSEIVNREISEYMQLKCDVCGIEMDTFGHIRKHMLSVHGAPPYIKCCEKKFIRRAYLYDHIKFHLNPDIFKCQKCGKVFSGKRNFNTHMIYMHPSEDTKIFECPQCPKKFARKHLLQSHKTQMHNKFKYFCSECKRGFSLKSLLKSHVALRHGTECQPQLNDIS